jgi:hypothetical protein
VPGADAGVGGLEPRAVAAHDESGLRLRLRARNCAWVHS